MDYGRPPLTRFAHGEKASHERGTARCATSEDCCQILNPESAIRGRVIPPPMGGVKLGTFRISCLLATCPPRPINLSSILTQSLSIQWSYSEIFARVTNEFR